MYLYPLNEVDGFVHSILYGYKYKKKLQEDIG